MDTRQTGTKMKNGKEVPDCKKEGSSAQSRLDRMAAKHGLGKPNKAADDYLAKMMKKYGAKDMADLKKNRLLHDGKSLTSRTFGASRIALLASQTLGQETSWANSAALMKKESGNRKEDVNENFRTLATKGMGAEKKSDIKVGKFRRLLRQQAG